MPDCWGWRLRIDRGFGARDFIAINDTYHRSMEYDDEIELTIVSWGGDGE